jgi:hypothetical protein
MDRTTRRHLTPSPVFPRLDLAAATPRNPIATGLEMVVPGEPSRLRASALWATLEGFVRRRLQPGPAPSSLKTRAAGRTAAALRRHR